MPPNDHPRSRSLERCAALVACLLALVAALTGATASSAVAYPLNGPIVGIAASGQSYWLTGNDGGVFTFGDVAYRGSMASAQLQAPVSGIAGTPSGGGYWLVSEEGGVFAFGDAPFVGNRFRLQSSKIVGMAASPSGRGYWLAAADGAVYPLGDARHFGDWAGRPLNGPIVGISRTPDGGGYWLVAADGGVLSFGNAPFHGSMGGKPLAAPMVGMAAMPDGQGYALTGADGGVFSFGSAGFHGSMAGRPLNQPVVGIAWTPSGRGYWLVAGDGGVFAFGDAQFRGSTAGDVAPPPPAESELRSAIVTAAVQEAGYREAADNCNAYYSDCQAWSSMFASAMWLRSGVRDFSMTTWTPNLVSWAQQRQHWRAGATSGPRIGDLAVYDVPSKGRSGHVGVVVEVTASGAIRTVDGNLRDRVIRSALFLPQEAVQAGMPGSIVGFASPTPITSAAVRTAAEPAWEPLPMPLPEGADPDGSGEFHVLRAPGRVLDTRSGVGAPTGALAAGQSVTVQVTGRAGVPDLNVAGVVLNLAAFTPTAPGSLRAHPAGQAAPSEGSVYYGSGGKSSTLVSVRVGANGAVTIRNSGGSTHVVAEVVGWTGSVLALPGARYTAVQPARLLDTRSSGSALPAGGTRALPVLGRGGVPSTGVQAVVLNVTAAAPTAMTGVTVYPTGGSRPVVANVYAAARTTRASLAVSGVASDGTVTIVNSAGTTHVVAEVVGWYGAAPAPDGPRHQPARGVVVLDTRTGAGTGGSIGKIPSGATVVVQVAGLGGLPASGLASVTTNLVSSGAAAPTTLQVAPGQPQEVDAKLYLPGAAPSSNLVITPLGTDGKLRITNRGSAADVRAVVYGFHR